MPAPVSVIIPTRDRPSSLRRTLESLSGQALQPREVVVADGSANQATRDVCAAKWPFRVRRFRTNPDGAAPQRNRAMRRAACGFVWFLDDDVILQPDCLERLYGAMEADPRLGGVNALITNQVFAKPGMAGTLVFHFLADWRITDFSGRCIGPGVNFLPRDRGAEVVPVDWLNTTCTLYRREALPDPPFPGFFRGYSMCEDLALSLIVARRWKLANIPSARVYHDSQPGVHKSNGRDLSAMELKNRHFVMRRVLGKQHFVDYFKLAVWEIFNLAAVVRQSPDKWGSLREQTLGKCRAVRDIMKNP